MKEIEFNVKFITPLLIGGANPREADSSGLTGKALRGCWRFWFRAIVGGMVKNITSEDLYQLESLIFGSAGRKDAKGKEIGAKFRVTIEGGNAKTDYFNLGFKRDCKKCHGVGKLGGVICDKCDGTGELKPRSKGYPENTSYSIIIKPRVSMRPDEVNVLLATIWVWGNLGAIGKRERRGFGSPILGLQADSNPFSFANIEGKTFKLPIQEKQFENVESIVSHLKDGLLNSFLIYRNWINNAGFTNIDIFDEYISTLEAPYFDAPYFILKSFEQIAVGSCGFNTRDYAIVATHGKTNCDGLGWVSQKYNKKPSPRMASPVFIRFYLAKEAKVGYKSIKFFPVVTWCKQKNIAKDLKPIQYETCVKQFLTNISVNNNLKGDVYS